jgi:hypothetical protein
VNKALRLLNGIDRDNIVCGVDYASLDKAVDALEKTRITVFHYPVVRGVIYAARLRMWQRNRVRNAQRFSPK